MGRGDQDATAESPARKVDISGRLINAEPTQTYFSSDLVEYFTASEKTTLRQFLQQENPQLLDALHWGRDLSNEQIDWLHHTSTALREAGEKVSDRVLLDSVLATAIDRALDRVAAFQGSVDGEWRYTKDGRFEALSWISDDSGKGAIAFDAQTIVKMVGDPQFSEYGGADEELVLYADTPQQLIDRQTTLSTLLHLLNASYRSEVKDFSTDWDTAHDEVALKIEDYQQLIGGDPDSERLRALVKRIAGMHALMEIEINDQASTDHQLAIDGEKWEIKSLLASLQAHQRVYDSFIA